MNIRDTILTVILVSILFLCIGMCYWAVLERRKAEKACGPGNFETASVIADHKVVCFFENDKVEIRKY